MNRLAILALMAILGADAPAATAQYYQPYQPAPAYYAPQTVYYAQPQQGAFPRVRRGLQVIADPSLLLPPQSPFGTGNAPSQYPLFDAAPNIVSLAAIGAIGTSSVALQALAFGLPPAIRLTRLILFGPPPSVQTRGQAVLWVASPIASYAVNVRRNRQQMTTALPYYAAPATAQPPQPRRGLLFRRR